jgi:hypothetical protein
MVSFSPKLLVGIFFSFYSKFCKRALMLFFQNSLLKAFEVGWGGGPLKWRGGGFDAGNNSKISDKKKYYCSNGVEQ